MTTVKELKELLDQFDDDAPVMVRDTYWSSTDPFERVELNDNGAVVIFGP